MLDGDLDDEIAKLFALAEAQQVAEDKEAEAISALIGDKGGPPLAELFGIGAPWLGHANEEELARLAKVEARIQRRKRILSDTIAERTKLMNRCIRRMRRAQGKN